MSESIYGYFFLILGIIAMALLILFGNINTYGEHNYYSLKEIAQNAMLDSVDEQAYRVGLQQTEVNDIDTIACVSGKPGTVRIITEKFVENFALRYAEVANPSNEYTVDIYEVQECPAKVSLKVTSKENYSWIRKLFGGASEANEDAVVETMISAILETKDIE